MKLNQLTPDKGAVKKRKRIGRGPGSGHGKTSGRGHKGQNSRSGGGVSIGFEGGQMPLHRRLPKRGFTNIFKKEYEIVNVARLGLFDANTEVTLGLLKKNGLVKKTANIKILGCGNIAQPLTVCGNKFSKEAIAKIEKAGGKVVVV